MAAPLADRKFESAVGPVVDVAQRGGLLRLSFAFYLLAGPFLLFMAAFLLVELFGGGVVQAEWGMIGIMAFVTGLFGWSFTAFAVLRVRQRGDYRIYLRAGPGGIDLAQPGFPRITRFLLSYRIYHWTLPWGEVRRWYPHSSYLNGIPLNRFIIFEDVQNTRVVADMTFFSGDMDTICARITVAARGHEPVLGYKP